MAKLDHCENSIEKQLGQLIKDRKVQQAAVCAKFTTFVECVGQLHAECGSLPKFRKNLCERRALKLSTYRYTWRYNFIYDLCHGSAPSGAAGGGGEFGLQNKLILLGVEFSPKSARCVVSFLS